MWYTTTWVKKGDPDGASCPLHRSQPGPDTPFGTQQTSSHPPSLERNPMHCLHFC